MPSIQFTPIPGVSLGFELDSWTQDEDTEYYIHLDVLLVRVTITLLAKNF